MLPLNSHFQPSVFELLKAQMMEAAAAKAAGGTNVGKLDTTNFMRQFRDADSRELKQLTAAQFMEVWDHYDDDGTNEQFVK